MPTQDEVRLHARVMAAAAAAGAGAGGVERVYDRAARAIQRLARSYILRKRNREGRFLASARRGWIDAHPPPPLPSHAARLRPEELLLLLRVLGAVPSIADEADVLDAAAQLRAKATQFTDLEACAAAGPRRVGTGGGGYRDGGGSRSGRSDWVRGHSWEEFCELLTWLAGCLPKKDSDGAPAGGGLDEEGAMQVARLFRTLFEPQGRPMMDRGDPRGWIRAMTRDYLDQVRRDADRVDASGRGSGGEAPGKPRHDRISEHSDSAVQRKPATATPHGSGGAPAAGTGCAEYLRACAKFDVRPVAGLARALLEDSVALAHHAFSPDDVFALAHCLPALPHVRTLDICDCHLQPAGLTALCNALRYGHALRSLDLSENTLDKAGCSALAGLLAATEGLARLELRGCRLTDELFDRLVVAGLEKNRSISHLNLAHNLLSDVSADALEGLLLGKPALRALDLSFNLLTDRGVERLQAAAVERSVPRSLNRARAGRTAQQLPPAALSADRRAQRHGLANLLGLNPCFRYEPPAKVVFTRADLLSLEVILRDKRLTDGDKIRTAALCTVGRSLTADEIIRLLIGCFSGCDDAHRRAALQLLEEVAESAHAVEVIRQGTRPTFAFDTQEQDQLD